MNQAEDALDEVMSALADATRREIYRRLRASPGMTTGELADATRGMTRWGVMKHLAVLRGAGLVQTFHDGRRRRHYTDPGRLIVISHWLEDAGGH